ncbi:nuclear RNA export factor 2-like [Cebus imitator]|uniref:nuclear RNA export factor 2-like n=1 Tax=Cebus imitator TaxID=2715852 RepID=UPI0018996448|nr:nuclear RNA export factor 2-like [Cebus imitator]
MSTLTESPWITQSGVQWRDHSSLQPPALGLRLSSNLRLLTFPSLFCETLGPGQSNNKMCSTLRKCGTYRTEGCHDHGSTFQGRKKGGSSFQDNFDKRNPRYEHGGHELPPSERQENDGSLEMGDVHKDRQLRHTPYSIERNRKLVKWHSEDQIHTTTWRNRKRPERKMMEDTQDGKTRAWFKVTIPYGGKYDKAWLMNSIQSHCSVPFTPLDFHYFQNRAHFFVQGASTASALKDVNYTICDDHNRKICIFVNHSTAPFSVKNKLKPSHMELLKLTMDKRYDVSQQALDLQSLCFDPDLTGRDIDIILNRRNCMAATLKIIESNFPELLSLNLCNNKLYQLDGLSDITEKAPKVKILNLSKNEVRRGSQINFGGAPPPPQDQQYSEAGALDREESCGPGPHAETGLPASMPETGSLPRSRCQHIGAQAPGTIRRECSGRERGSPESEPHAELGPDPSLLLGEGLLSPWLLCFPCPAQTELTQVRKAPAASSGPRPNSAIQDCFPKLLRLDGRELSSTTTVDIDSSELMKPCEESCNGSETLKHIVLRFLQQYYSIYDSGDRRGLLGAYHEEACFSVTIPFNPEDSAPKSLSQYFEDSRNIKTLKDPYLREELLKHTKRDIVDFLSALPKTQHDLSSILVDMWYQTKWMLCFSVNGVFKEVEGQSQGSVLAFTRTFIATPGSNSSLCIVNDELFVRDASPQETQSAFSIPVSTPSSSSEPSLSREQQEMVQAFSAQSGMKLEWSQKCLQDNEWNYTRAGQVFTMLQTQGKIPAEAFKQIP